jgi:hypothetical protein
VAEKGLHIEVRGKLMFHWVLIAGNGEVLATSETYFSKSNADRAAKRLSEAIGVPSGREL